MTSLRSIALGASLLATGAFAQVITVTSPQSGDILGKTNSIRFNVDSATSQVRVVVTATKNDNPLITLSNEGIFDPDINSKVAGSVDLNFDETTPAGTYTIKVQLLRSGTEVSSRTIDSITIDTRDPKFRNVSPSSGSFVSFSVPIRAQIEESNVDRWRVRINDKDIANNTGTDNFVNVLWNTTSVENDGAQTISIKVDDRARNQNTRSVNVTLDRVSPSTTVKSPLLTSYRPGSTIPVLINIEDQYQGSVVNQGVDVSIRTMTGTFIQKVARRSARAEGSTLVWVGRITNTLRLPDNFKLVVTAQDRAGNRAVVQEMNVVLAGR
jgi:hypothetical protein